MLLVFSIIIFLSLFILLRYEVVLDAREQILFMNHLTYHRLPSPCRMMLQLTKWTVKDWVEDIYE